MEFCFSKCELGDFQVSFAKVFFSIIGFYAEKNSSFTLHVKRVCIIIFSQFVSIIVMVISLFHCLHL